MLFFLFSSKLLGVLEDRYTERVFNMRRNNTMEPSLSDLSMFIDEETTFLINPLLQEMLFPNTKKKRRSLYERKRWMLFWQEMRLELMVYKIKHKKRLNVQYAENRVTLSTVQSSWSQPLKKEVKWYLRKITLWMLPKCLEDP